MTAPLLWLQLFDDKADVLIVRHRWAQFSARTMLACVAVICVWLASRVEQSRRQREAIAELHKLHVAVLYREPGTARDERLDGGERLLGLAFRETVDYVGFQHAARLFHDPQSRAKALSLLPHLRGLKRLSLEGMPVTDQELLSLKRLTDLQKVNLTYTDVTDAGAAELQRALPNCQIVR
jgi:hypothetical protein